jgi:hypothetical protein
VPTTAFKAFVLSSLPPGGRTIVFRSSGTTGLATSRHYHDAGSLALYETSLRPWFRAHLLAAAQDATAGTFRFLVFAPPPAEVPDSSLAFMFSSVASAFARQPAGFLASAERHGGWRLDGEAAAAALQACEAAHTPALLLGTAFTFVHLLDHLAARNLRFHLPPGSRLMETGGYKGRSRGVPKAELHALLRDRLGLADTHLVVEYGMSELGSQAYDRVVGTTAPRVFQFPPWARARVISPEDGREVVEGETGLLQVFDLANVRSVCALQTEDLAVRRDAGFELTGRAALAEPRGCSLRAQDDPA